jgi:hypothetical protein
MEDLKGVIASEMENSLTDELVSKKQTAMKYYEGELPPKPDTAGRSGVVSTDVADSIEWLIPNIIESLSGKSVKFMPVSAQDEDQAALETDLCHFAWTEDNNGFLSLYESVKDALLTGVGIMKVYFDDAPERSVEHYTGLDENQLQALLGDPMVEITEIERSQTEGIGVTCARIIRQGNVKIEAVPVEEFRICDDADSLNVDEARFVAHTVRRSASDLLAQGYDPEAIENASTEYMDREVGTMNLPSHMDESEKQVVVTEAYVRYDANDDGISELLKVTYTGETNPEEILDIEEIPFLPFVAMSAIPTPHRFVGVSIYERMKQVQDVKTAVLRTTLDGMYYQNHKQRVVVEGQVNLDDMLSARPGNIIRAKSPNAVQELGGNFFSGEALQLLTYADTQKDNRVGVSPNASGQNSLVNTDSAHGVERLMTARESLVNMMVRSVAETGLKPAYTKIRNLMVMYQTATVPWKWRGQWQNINPTSWGDRSRIMCTVGSGTADSQAKLMDMQQLLGVQQTLMTQDPMNPLCDYNKVHNTLKTMIDIADLGDSDKYFYDPETQEGQQYAQQKMQEGQQNDQENMQKEQFQLQMQQQQVQAQTTVAQAEMGKAQATLQVGQMKAQVDQMKAQHASEIDALEAQLKAMSDSKDQEFKRMQLQTNAALELTKLEVQAKRDLTQQNADNQAGKVDSKPAAKASSK